MPQIGSLIDWTQLEEGIPELEDMTTETPKTEKQRQKKTGKKTPKQNRIPKNCGTTTKCVTCVMGTLEGEEREKGTEAVSEAIMTENFPKLMLGTKPQIQETQRTRKINTKQINK